jgi:hypothetical protein
MCLQTVLSEVNRDHRAAGPETDSVIRSHAAEASGSAMSALGEGTWERWFVLSRCWSGTGSQGPRGDRE